MAGAPSHASGTEPNDKCHCSPTYSLARHRPAVRPPARHCLLPSLSSVSSVPRRPHFVAAVHILASFSTRDRSAPSLVSAPSVCWHPPVGAQEQPLLRPGP